MDNLRPDTLKREASRRLADAREGRRTLLVYCGILLILSIVTTGGNYLLSDMMARSGGLGAIGRRTMISTFQKILPIVNMLGLLILELGLWNAMLRIGRGQYVSPQSLKMGLDRFFPWLRCLLLQTMGYSLIGMALMTVAMAIFFVTPLSRPMLELMVPLMLEHEDTMAIMELMMTDEALMLSMYEAVLPVYVILGILMLIACVPIAYRLRLAQLVLIDRPGCGGIRAIIESFKLTKGFWKFFLKLDLSWWWYYGLQALSTALLYLDLFLVMIGKPLPMCATAAALLAYGLYLVTQVALYYFLRPRVHVSAAVLYDAITPKQEAPGNTVVLGNIFQM